MGSVVGACLAGAGGSGTPPVSDNGTPGAAVNVAASLGFSVLASRPAALAVCWSTLPKTAVRPLLTALPLAPPTVLPAATAPNSVRFWPKAAADTNTETKRKD